MWNEPKLMFNEMFRGKNITRKGGLKNFRMSDFEIRKDGSAVVVAEGYRVVEIQKKNSNGSTSSSFYYYYDDIVVRVTHLSNILFN